MIKKFGAGIERLIRIARDPTDHKRLETALREKQAFQDTIIDKSPFAMWVSDPTGKVIRTNTALRAFLNLTDEQILGSYNVLEDTNLTKQGVMPAIKAVFEKGGTARFTIPWRAADAGDAALQNGRDLYIDVSMFPIVDDGGNLKNVVCQWIDITERKEAEERLRKTLDSTPFPCAVVDERDDRIFYWSKSAVDLFGYSPKSAAEWHTLAYPDRAYQEQVLSLWKPALERARNSERAVNTGVYRVTCADGRQRTCEIYAQFVPGFRIVTFNDISSRTAAVNELAASEARFRAIFDNMTNGVAVYESADDGKEFIFRDINPAGAGAGRRERSEHIGRNVREVYPGVEDMGLLAVFRRVWQTGAAEHHPVTAYEDDRVAMWVENYVCKLPSGQIMAVYDDVTESRRARQELEDLAKSLERRVDERTAQLEAANRELEGFSYSVSHDLRAPLRAISGFAHILSDRYSGALDEKGRHYLANIEEAGDQMSRLVEDLLRYSRLGREALSLELISPRRLFDDVLQTLAHQISEAGAEISIDTELPLVLVDTTLLESVFINLIDNAIKYRNPGVSPIVRVTARDRADAVVIDIADNGIGIDPRFHKKIFDVFQRLHPAESYPGTGIGLAAAARAVALMGGRVWVDSEPGKGSTFHVSLQKEESDD